MIQKRRSTMPHEKLANSLVKLKVLQDQGRRVFQSGEFTRLDRERLIAQGFLREVINGWLISTSPSTDQGDTTPWYASFWEFCAHYCHNRFKEAWHLSPEQSLLLHAENTTIPKQVIIYSTHATNNTIKLLFNTSLYDLKQTQRPSADHLMIKNGLRLFTPTSTLIKVPEAFFASHPIEAQVVLSSIKDSSEILRHLLEGGHSAIAGRLAGAFYRIGRKNIADEITETMKGAGYDIRKTDPFLPKQTLSRLNPSIIPIVGRINALWESMRKEVIVIFPKTDGLPKNKKHYLHAVDEIYQNDAYHSLSIEGYHVTPELIEHVRSGNWNPDKNETDKQNRDALAARGYWQAFQNVKESISKIIDGDDPGILVRTVHRNWYRELFQPSVQAGLISSVALAGYRNQPVFLRGSRHVPPRTEILYDATSALFDLIEKETEPCVRAVLGHWLFGYIHPYPDGNGRIARFLMNALLASGGYPWTIIRIEDRRSYLKALENASIESDIFPFAKLIAERVHWSMQHSNL